MRQKHRQLRKATCRQYPSRKRWMRSRRRLRNPDPKVKRRSKHMRQKHRQLTKATCRQYPSRKRWMRSRRRLRNPDPKVEKQTHATEAPAVEKGNLPAVPAPTPQDQEDKPGQKGHFFEKYQVPMQKARGMDPQEFENARKKRKTETPNQDIAKMMGKQKQPPKKEDSKRPSESTSSSVPKKRAKGDV